VEFSVRARLVFPLRKGILAPFVYALFPLSCKAFCAFLFLPIQGEQSGDSKRSPLKSVGSLFFSSVVMVTDLLFVFFLSGSFVSYTTCGFISCLSLRFVLLYGLLLLIRCRKWIIIPVTVVFTDCHYSLLIT
jgi:hypothetical protein